MQIKEFGKIAQQNWLNLPSYYSHIVIDKWSVMPNHFRSILFIVDEGTTVEAIHELPLQKLWYINEFLFSQI